MFATLSSYRGNKHYEMANHLGNVLTVISDKKLINCSNGTFVSYFTNFTAERISATDYSPFGAPLAGRTWNGGEYRFGFNSMEKDNELNGNGNAYDFGARIYDARLGRWLGKDPKENCYPSWSTYNAFLCNPIYIIDPNGEGGIVSRVIDDETGRTIAISVKATIYVYSNVKEIQENITSIANEIETDIESNWNNVITSEGVKNPTYTDSQGNTVPVHFEVTVIPLSRSEVEHKVNSGDVKYGENFVELVNNSVPSQFEGNSGIFNVIDNVKKGCTSYSHEFGHLLEFYNKDWRKGDPDNEYHRGNNNPDISKPISIMFRDIDISRIIAGKTLDILRRVHQNDVNGLNNGRGVGKDIIGQRGVNQANVGIENNNKIYNEGEEVTK